MDTYPEPLLGPRPASWESAPSHQSLNPHHRQRVMVTSSTPRMVAVRGPPGPLDPHVTPLQADRSTYDSDQTALHPVPQTAPGQLLMMRPAQPSGRQPVSTSGRQLPRLSPTQQAFADALERRRLDPTRLDSADVKIKIEPVSSAKFIPPPRSVTGEDGAAMMHDTNGYEPFSESGRAQG